MPFCLSIVVDIDKPKISVIVFERLNILLTPDLLDGTFCRLLPLTLYDSNGFVDVIYVEESTDPQNLFRDSRTMV